MSLDSATYSLLDGCYRAKCHRDTFAILVDYIPVLLCCAAGGSTETGMAFVLPHGQTMSHVIYGILFYFLLFHDMLSLFCKLGTYFLLF